MNDSIQNIQPSNAAIKMKLLLKKARELKEAREKAALSSDSSTSNSLTNNSDSAASVGMHGEAITYNEEQLRFIQTATTGKSCILVGAAGTGKTTSMRGTMLSLIQSGRAGILHSDGHKYLPASDSPGIVVVSFTRRAVANIRKAMVEDMKGNCLTIHALLEYSPVYYSVIDPVTGEDKNTMRFEPTRNMMRPLPSSIRICVIEESSMVSVELFKELQCALPSNCQYIFLGDIQQLPPVFGSAILGFKMLELPTVELTQVYRQAMESPIIRLAHRILSGKGISSVELPEWKIPNQLTLHPWKKQIKAETACNTAAMFLIQAETSGAYDPENDMVLVPFNKSFGTLELNKKLANHLAKKRGAIVYEIVSGFNKHYFSIGDKVLYDKEDAVIVDIKHNMSYTGSSAQPASVTLDYWGHNSGESDSNSTNFDSSGSSEDDLDFLLEQSANLSGDSSDRVRQSSHIVTLRMANSDTEAVLDTASEVNSLLLGYTLTVHKSQGSEFRKVFLFLHQSHATMLSRELLYTAVTRAKEELYVICEPDSFINGIKSQRIKGNTLSEKAEYFKGKLDSTDVYGE